MSVLSADIKLIIDDQPRHLSFELKEGVTALIGPSGAGKTTLARALAGIQPDIEGDIKLDGVTLAHTPVQQRGIGLVMQEPTLFPTMSAGENIELSNKLSDIELSELIDITGISSILDKPAPTLSGGEARRVAIVRAIAAKPKLLILDEPTSGLDPRRRLDILRLSRDLSVRTGVSVLLITHQIDEMLSAADQALLMNEGAILAAGGVTDVLAHPDTSRLLGADDAGSLLTATISARSEGLLEAKLGNETIYLSDDDEPIGAQVRLRILARDVALSKARLTDISVLNQLKASIETVLHHNGYVDVFLSIEEQQLTCRITEKSFKTMQLKEGENLYCLIKAVAVKELMQL